MSFLQTLIAYLPLILFVFQILLALGMLAMKGKFTPREDHQKLAEEQENHTLRLGLLENKVTQMPDTAALHALSLQISKLEGDLRSIKPQFERLDTVIDRMQTQVDRMEDYLKSKGVP